MLGCLNQKLGKIWTNPNVGLKILFKFFTQLQLYIFNYIYNPTFGFVNNIWVEITQHFLECTDIS